MNALRLLFYWQFGKGYAPPPQNVTWEITYKCNLKCKHCHLKKNVEHRKEISTTQFKTIILPQFVENQTRVVALTGGEPFVRKDIFDIMDAILASGIGCNVASNLTIYTKASLQRLAELGVGIMTSIDGSEEIHNAIRGDGNFKKTVTAIQRIHELRGRGDVLINCVVSHHNFNSFSRVVDVAAGCGAKNVSFQLLDFLPTISSQQYDPKTRPSEYTLPSNISQVEPRILYEEAANAWRNGKKEGIQISFTPLKYAELSISSIEKWYYGVNFHRGDYKCIYPWTHIRMNPYGGIYPCLGIDMGNILEDTLEGIWNGGKYIKFRKEIRKKLTPKCQRCCKLAPLYRQFARQIYEGNKQRKRRAKK